MQYLSNLMEIPVLALGVGRQIGTVEEVLISLDTALLEGIVIKNTAWFSDKQHISFAEIHHIGADAITIKKEEAAEPFHPGEVDRLQVYDLRYLQGKSIVSETGIQMGALSDILFDSVTGEIKAFEVSDGVISDLLYGRANLPLPPAQLVCDDRMIVPESMIELLRFRT